MTGNNSIYRKSSIIWSSIIYANNAWEITYATKLKKLYLKQKHAVCNVFHKDKLTQSKLLFGNLNAFNVYRINTYQQLNFMHKFINNQILSIFSDIIKRNDHKYPTKFSLSSCFLKRYSLNSTKCFIYIRGTKLWNDVINKEEKDIQPCSLSQKD